MRSLAIAALVALLALAGCHDALNPPVPVDARAAARDAALRNAMRIIDAEDREVAQRYLVRRAMQASLAARFGLSPDLPREGLSLREAIEDQRRYEQASANLAARRDLARASEAPRP